MAQREGIDRRACLQRSLQSARRQIQHFECRLCIWGSGRVPLVLWRLSDIEFERLCERRVFQRPWVAVHEESWSRYGCRLSVGRPPPPSADTRASAAACAGTPLKSSHRKCDRSPTSAEASGLSGPWNASIRRACGPAAAGSAGRCDRVLRAAAFDTSPI
jgi:hypothetical protein